MNSEDFENTSRPDDLQGILRDAVDAVRAIPPEVDSQERAFEHASRWAASLPCSKEHAVGAKGTVPFSSTMQAGCPRKLGQSPKPRQRIGGRRVWWPIIATALTVAICFCFFPSSNGSTNLLAEVFKAFDRAAAFHLRINIMNRSERDTPLRTIDKWIVRGTGSREEVKSGGKLAAISVDNLRWLMRWSIADNQVIAWPSRMTDSKWCNIEDNPFFTNREKCVQWGEHHKAAVERKKDNLDGREVEKVELSWPGGVVEDQIVLWFDPETMRPVKAFIKSVSPVGGSMAYDMAFDYPDPGTLPAERFTLQIPRGAELEINDPQFGRQIYSEGLTSPLLDK
jgi:hypothetical protein